MTEIDWLGDNQLSLDIWRNKYRKDENETFEEWLDRVSDGNSEIKRLIREKKFLFGGRTLANRGIPDSGSFSNCYSIGYVPDSLDGIMDVAHKIAMTFKAQGGQGLSLSNIRPKGAMIGGKYPSDGIVPFMNIFNTVTESVSQGGSRKGALMMSIDAWHPEVETFITIKEDPNAITKANLSVEVDNDFMGSVVWQSPEDPNRDRTRKIFDTICKSAWKSAEPGVLFVNRLRNYNLMEFVDNYQIETTNPCGEQPLGKHMACNLSSINVSEYVLNPYTKEAKIDYQSLNEDIYTIVTEMDKVLEENLDRHALPEQKEQCKKWRNIGIGIMGLADLFVKLGVRYGSPESITLAKELMRDIFCRAVIVSSWNGKDYGNFPGYNPRIWDSNIIKDTFTYEEIKKLRKQNTLRNCSLISIAPTGSIGTMLNISTGVEPFFALSFNRKTVSMSGETYKVEVKAVEEYRKVTGNQGELPDYFVTAQDIPWKERIDMQAALQEYCDTAISSTVNLPRETTVEEVKELYKYAWEKGLKGVTIYREGSRDPILSVEKKEEEKSEIIPIQPENPNELKRGEVIATGDHWLGLKRTLTTGCGTLHVESFWDPDTGELRECYLSKGSTGGCNNFMIGLSRMISLAARGGIGIDKILDQLKSCGVCPSYAVRSATKKDCSKGSCCPVAVGNALKDMHKEIQDIICECKENNTMTKEDLEKENEALKKEIEALKKRMQELYSQNIVGCFDPHTGKSWAKIFKEREREKQASTLEECPSCHEKTLMHQGGCVACYNCSYTKCN